MGDLVDSLVRVFEILIQGFLATCVLGFALVWIHPIKRAVFAYIKEIHNYITEGRELPNIVVVLIMLGMVYFLGILTNVIGYWVLEPVHHFEILHADDVHPREPAVPLHASARGQADPRPGDSSPKQVPGFTRALLLPLTREIPGFSRKDRLAAYADYVREETVWRNCKLEPLRHALDPQIKQFRIVRGTIVCSLAFTVIALGKFVYFVVIFLFVSRSYRTGTWVDRLYRHTVDPSAAEGAAVSPQINQGTSQKEAGAVSPDGKVVSPEAQTPPSPPKRGGSSQRQIAARTTRRFATAALTISFLSSCLYVLSLFGWHTVEREYHLMVRYGAESCTPGNQEPEAVALREPAPVVQGLAVKP